MKFASGDLQGPASSESVILQERGPRLQEPWGQTTSCWERKGCDGQAQPHFQCITANEPHFPMKREVGVGRVGSGLNLTQELNSPGGGMFLCYFLAKPKGGTKARPPAQVRGSSGHLPSWAHEFSEVEGERMGALADPAPTKCQASQHRFISGQPHENPGRKESP